MFHEAHIPEAVGDARPVACVTGAARNIGRAIAERLERDGYQIVVTTWAGGDAPSEPGDPVTVDLDEARELGKRTGWAVLGCDLAAPSDCSELVSSLRSRYGRLDCLVNNAATWTYTRLDETSDEDWRRVLEINVVAVVRLVREARELLAASPAPRVINVGSSCGFLPEAGVGPYCVSKAAVHALTGWLAVELAADGVLVNAVAPGFINTSTNATAYGQDRGVDRRLAAILVGRPGEVEEVANVVSFLASPQLGFVTGEIVRCDGGFLSGASERLFSS